MGEVKNKDGNIVGYFYNDETPEERDRRRSLMAPPNTSIVPTTSQELKEFAIDFFYDCIQIANKKNTRYAGPIDPFKNFRLGGTYGIVIRMTDKVSRLLTLLDPTNKISESDESIEDTCRDLANYSMLLAGMLANEKIKNKANY